MGKNNEMKQIVSKRQPVGSNTMPSTNWKPAPKTSDKKLPKQMVKRKNNVATEKNSLKSNDTVTLTKEQFNEILETIGKLSMESKKHDTDTQQILENGKPVFYEENYNRSNSGDKEPRVPHMRADYQHDNKLTEHEIPFNGISNAKVTLAERKRLEWQRENDMVETGWHNQDGNYRMTNSEMRLKHNLNQAAKYTGMEKQASPEHPPLTIAEKKRLQWQKERAELSAIGVYDPWGRGGGGAPLKDQFGNTINDFNRRQDILASSRNWAEKVHTANFPPVDSVPFSSSQLPPIQKAWSNPDSIDAMKTNEQSWALDDSRFLSQKDRQKQQWLEDLEKQREDQMLRKQAEKMERLGQSPGKHYWGDSNGVRGVGRPVLAPLHNIPPAGHLDHDESAERHSAPVMNIQDQVYVQFQPSSDGGHRTFLHGQNRIIDPITQMEQEEKRRKYLELQDYNRKQAEEREKKRQEEKKQRHQEDMEEENKLRHIYKKTAVADPGKAELAVEIPSKIEDTMAVNKEEREQCLEDTLKQGLEAARMQAEREKRERLLEKLKKGNHDIQHLVAGYEGKPSARVTTRHDGPVQHTFHAQVQPPSTRTVTHVVPQYIPGLSTGSLLPGPGDSLDNFSLNPGQTSETAGKLQESGTQTALNQFLIPELSRDSTEVEYRPELHLSDNNSPKNVRIISAPKVAKLQREAERTSKSLEHKQNKRPIWGYKNTEQKRPVKQSDRDISHVSQQQRMKRRTDRQNELLEIVERTANRVAKVTGEGPRWNSNENLAEDDNRHMHAKNSRNRNPSRGQNHGHSRDRSQGHGQNRDHNREYSLSHSTPSQNHSIQSNVAQSPQIPAMKRKLDSSREMEQVSRADRYSSQPPGIIASQTNFAPYIRTSNVLDPAHAESPLYVSREPSEVEKVRRAHQSALNPAKYGQPIEPMNSDGAKSKMGTLSKSPPVRDHPTHLETSMLENLSKMRRLFQAERQKIDKYGSVV